MTTKIYQMIGQSLSFLLQKMKYYNRVNFQFNIKARYRPYIRKVHQKKTIII